MDFTGDRTRRVTLKVNGTLREAEVDVRLTLADFLRGSLALTGTHLGCEHGVCGACTIIVNGASTRSCLIFAVQADGCDVVTVEGVAESQEELHPLQAAFRDHHALQCGFCTPGMLMTLLELLGENPDPSEDEIKDAISGNICRCTGYSSIVAATLDAAARLRTKA